MKFLKYAHSFEVVSELPEALQPLRKLAMNFRWTWHHETQQLFSEVDPQLWTAVEHNPLELINRLSAERKEKLAQDEVFLVKLQLCERDLDEYLTGENWFDETYKGEREKTKIAYFCAEFGVSESLPIYSGGLGVLAGDHLKAASDLGLPLVGVGLLYSRGYFRQRLSPEGWQQEYYPDYDFYRMPLELLRGDNHQPLRVTVEFPDRTVTCQIWRADIGRIKLYLLDSNVLENAPDDQTITDTLYGGDEQMRIRQEMILGIGGMKALKTLGIKPTVCHMNEGHAAFLTIERLQQIMEEHSCDNRLARQIVVAGNVFTTHTPVPAGFDIFHRDVLEKFMRKEVEQSGWKFDEFVRLGKFNGDDASEGFNMAILAMANANYVNGVSLLHAEVSRGMFSARWPDYPVDEVPVEGITNGIHTPTWISWRMTSLMDQYVGGNWRRNPSDPDVWAAAAESIPDHDLWELRENQRGDFIRFCRRRLVNTLMKRNASRQEISNASSMLDPRALTIGFARRFATYKRATLMFTDKERLKSILFNAERPVQIVLAGKSHPRDDGGKNLIQEIHNFINHEGGSARMLFLEDYDMEVARWLVQGVDVWLNNPRRPMEASGTSGMKVVPNGGLNCSVLDGWWAEGYAPGRGWAIGDESDETDQGHRDWLDSRSLYQLLEQEIAPTFYARGENGLPNGWLEMMRKSMKELAPYFSTSRMVEDYATKFYMPSSTCFNKLQENSLAAGREAFEWRRRVLEAWKTVSIAKVSDDSSRSNALGGKFEVSIDVALGALKPDDVRVQLLVGTVGTSRELHNLQHLDAVHDSEQGTGVHRFKVAVKLDRPGHLGYIARVMPKHANVRVETELALVSWQKA
ncbi:MAG: alpha-glucan family phosphorylase [Armatimonadetes bacterium]|nr:alpha-glucan family phosphorylase [Armatimonadota bacterium]